MTVHILVVDDDPGVRRLLVRLLELEGCVVDSCLDASEALVRLSSQPYDILLTDCMMRGMSGLALARTAREKQLALRCIVISGLAAPADEELGAVTWLCKPLDFDRLLRLLRE